MFRKLEMRRFLFFLLVAMAFGDARGYSVRKRHTSPNDFVTTISPSTLESETHSHASWPSLLEGCDPCPENILCVPQIQCPAHVRQLDHEKPQICDLPGGGFGYCCETGQNHTGAPKAKEKERRSWPHSISMDIVEESRLKFEQLMEQMMMVPVKRGRPEFTHGIVFHSSPIEDRQNFHLSNTAMEQVITSQLWRDRDDIPVDDIITSNAVANFGQTPLAQSCIPPPRCLHPPSPYRTFDGTCNNPLAQRSHWGAAGQPMQRLLPPAYEDGIWTPRLHSAVDGSPLMGARQVSLRLLKNKGRPHPKHNLMLMQFGQFIAHDITQTTSVRLENGELVQCCSPNGASPLPPHQQHFACMPIVVDRDDEFYADFKVGCLNFVRLSLAPSPDCKLGYGKQRSKVTHFLDASPVYGSSVDTARQLRTFRGGRLQMLDDFGRDLLPLNDDPKACDSTDRVKTCFKSGDGRTNQIISLVAMHILFAREHNRLASQLAAINPTMSDEMLFQEARRILIAEMQHIVYNEYLPAVIGHLEMQRFRLEPRHHAYADDYDVNVNPAITNEFTGAAFRMGHSSVDGKFHMRHGNNISEIVHIPDTMFNPSLMRQRSFYDDLLRTMLQQPMQQVDSSMTHGLSRYLFRGENPFGFDLAALNIQRGRDQALRPYNDYLEVMGHRRIRSFQQLPPEVSQRLSQVYKSPEDIDLWIGGLLENPVEGGIVGITFAEIIADQFSRFKRGDRYFYEYGRDINPGAFTLDQLHQIRKVSMARLICDNSDGKLREVPLSAFEQPAWPR